MCETFYGHDLCLPTLYLRRNKQLIYKHVCAHEPPPQLIRSDISRAKRHATSLLFRFCFTTPKLASLCASIFLLSFHRKYIYAASDDGPRAIGAEPHIRRIGTHSNHLRRVDFPVFILAWINRKRTPVYTASSHEPFGIQLNDNGLKACDLFCNSVSQNR